MASRSKKREEFAKRGSKEAKRRMQMIAELGIDDQEQKKKGR
jgi:hypothetical protein